MRQYLGYVVGFLTYGLTDYLGWTDTINRWGSNLVDMSSDAYRYGTYAGMVADIVMTLIPGYGVASRILRGIQFIGGLGGGIEAAVNGEWGNAALSLAGSALQGMRALRGGNSACRPMFNNGTANMLFNGAQRGLTAITVGRGAVDGVRQIINGDLLGGSLSLLHAGVNARSMFQSCFRGRMLVDEQELGKKRADAIQKGDKLLSRSEFDPDGPLAYKEVEEVFVRVSRIWNVEVAGQIIETTPEHPFYVEGKGWVPAAELQVGDLVSSRNGLLVPVEAVTDSGEIDTVYNWRVADYHTYFVSATEDGASIWAHNASYIDRAVTHSRTRRGLVENRNPRTGDMQWSRRSGLAGDHSLPRQAVSQAIRRYERANGPLSKDQRQQIRAHLNGRDNLQPMLSRWNSSKGALSSGRWGNTGMGRDADRGFLRDLGRRQRRVANEINEVFNGAPDGRDWFRGFFR